MKELAYISKTGKEIASVSDDFAQLRIAVFREFPYLYEGSLEYEKNYAQTYSNSEKAFLFGVYDGNQMVGATTCIPLRDETEEVQLPFKSAGIEIDQIFYFGESILLPGYRGFGIGHRFFDKRESHVKNLKEYHTTCFCAVNRPDDHLLKPMDYRSNDSFWIKRGYKKNPDLTCRMSWMDLEETEPSDKELTFWTKKIL